MKSVKDRVSIKYIISIIILLILSIALYFSMQFFNTNFITDNGYMVKNSDIDEILLSKNTKYKYKNIKLVKVNDDDSIYKNLNKYYVSKEDSDVKREVNITYPIYTNDGQALVSLDEKSRLINNLFDYNTSITNSTITDGHLFNTTDMSQADSDNYILLELSNKVYMNLEEITFNTNTIKKKIPVNSIISFSEDFIKYFYYNNKGFLEYGYIEGIDINNLVVFKDKKYTYEYILYKLGVIDELYEEDDIHNIEVPVEEVNIEEEHYQLEDKTTNGPIDAKKPEWKWIKPKVSAEEFKYNVYSATSRLSIYDPAGVIIGTISFQFTVGDKTFMRKTFTSGGLFEIRGLIPNTTFTVTGKYKYYDIEKKKIENQFFTQTFTTGDYTTLEPIALEYETGEVYSNQLEIKNIKITSDLNAELIKGIKKAFVKVGEEEFAIPSDALNKMYKGQAGYFLSNPKLESNSNFKYKIIFKDSLGNILPTIQTEGQARTSKEVPSTFVKIIDSTVKYIKFQFTLSNKDNADINNYRYVIYNKEGVIVSNGYLENTETQTITLDTLDPNSVFNMEVFADYDTADGKGVYKDIAIGSAKFTTLPLSSLGYIRVSNSVSNISDSSATISTAINKLSTNSILLELLSSFQMKVYDIDGNEIYSKVYNQNELNELIAGNDIFDDIGGLSSKNEYSIKYFATVKQGNTEEKIQVLSSVNTFKTLKVSATVNIANLFVNKSMIVYDVRIDDKDEAISSDRVILEVRDSSEKLVFKKYLRINSDYEEIDLQDLNPLSEYSFKYSVEEYNEGYNNSTYVDNYTLYETTILTKDGISGKIVLDGLVRQINGNNLFDLDDYGRIRTDGNVSSKEYDLNNKQVMFSAKNGYVSYSYFLPEGYSKTINISFYAKYDPETKNRADVYIGKNYGQSLDYKLTNLNDEWKEYSFTFVMNTDYIAFVINEAANQNMKTKVLFKNIMIQSVDITDKALNNATYSYHNSNYIFTNTQMYAGNEEMPGHDGETTIVGNYGNGFAKITNIDTGEVNTFDYTGSYQTFTPNVAGDYKFELWGAAGGDGYAIPGYEQTSSSHGGRGAYTSGVLTLKRTDTFYVYVGGAGKTGKGTNRFKGPVGGFNGGGDGGNSSSGSGGGATDIRVTSGEWNNKTSLESRIMVAAGGGGSDDKSGTYLNSNDGSGGPGGALKSIGAYINGALDGRYFATQITGNAFGIGGSVTTNTDTGGAGGGYYGGVVTNNNSGGASGGSSYISGYKGCIAYNKATTTILNFEEYQEESKFKGDFYISLYDALNEIPTDDYYIRIYKDDVMEQSYNYLLENNQIENILKSYKFQKNKTYTIRLSVKIRNKYYDIDELVINTSSEIRTIRTIEEFFNMHPSSNYIVLNDLDFTNVNRSYATKFYGTLDFQGYKMIFNVYNHSSYMFHTIAASGVIKNIVLEVTIDNPSSRSWFYGLNYVNYGKIDNMMIHVVSSTINPNYVFTLGSYVNYGTISNFVAKLDSPLSAMSRLGVIVQSNQGIIRNGYVYGENINGYYENESTHPRKDLGVIAGSASGSSIIENVFSLISVEKNNLLSTEDDVGNIIGYNSNGTIRNTYSVEMPNTTNTNKIAHDPNIGTVGSITTSNLYYISDKVYGGDNLISEKIPKTALSNPIFQNKVLNSNNNNIFNVDDFVTLGYFPQLNMNDCMPPQDWIELPSITDADLTDIISADEVESNVNSAIVNFNFVNKSYETIKSIKIQDIGNVEIISQENDSGNSIVKARLYNPSKYKSTYYITEFVSTNAAGLDTVTTYGEYERAIKIDLYYPINSLSDFKLIRSDPNQNYALTTDLDFNDVIIKQYVVNAQFKGKFNGNNHTMKNITIVSDYDGMFHYLNGGTIKNLFVENYTKTNFTSYSGFVGRTANGAVIDNVHIKNENVSGTSYIGGLVGYANKVTIKNSSTTNFKNTVRPSSLDIRVGGIAGYSSGSSLITNTFSQDVDISITDSISTYGLGGIVGQMADGNIENVYSTGKIESNSSYTGGIVGYSSCTISKAWSKVDISTQLDYVGGIVGLSTNENISNTLVLGSIYSTYSGENIHRTVGNALTNPANTYAWDKQKYYGYVVGNATSDLIISEEDIFTLETYHDLILFQDNFDYSKLQTKILPKLKNNDTGELLPNQVDNKLEKEIFDIINSEISTPAADNTADIILWLDNPDNLEVTRIKFDYISIINTRSISTSDGQTYVSVKVGVLDSGTDTDGTTDRALDSYSLTGVYYKDANGKEKLYNKTIKINLQFYKTLSSYQDWQGVSQEFPENYKLTNDIDFSDKTTINNNVKFSRLEGQDNGYTISGIKLTNNTSNYALINVLTTYMSNVTFDNIEITSTAGSNYQNIIKINFAEIDNVNFTNIKIIAPKASYVSIIGRNRGANITNINLDNCEMKGVSYVAGFIAHSLNYSTANITANNMNIYGTTRYIGGVIGCKDYSYPAVDFNYTITNVDVTGQTDVGGGFGYGGANYSTLTHSTVHGLAGGEYIGGFAGRNSIRYATNINANDVHVFAESNNRVGGLFGWTYDVKYAYLKDAEVHQYGEDKIYVGGMTGARGYSYSYVGITNVKVENQGMGTGGLYGYLTDGISYYAYANNVEVIGQERTGGIVGYGVTYRLYHNIVNAKVSGTNYVGGAAGFTEKVDDTNSSLSSIAYGTIIANCEVTGNNFVGGFTGYAPEQLTDKFFYNNIIVGNFKSTAENSRIGIVSGFDDIFSNSVPRMYIYQYNKYNERYVSTYISNDYPIPAANIITLENLKTQSFYTSRTMTTTYWDFSLLSTNHFPRIKPIEENQLSIPLPTGTSVTYGIYGAKLKRTYTNELVELPNYNIYPSDIHTINIDFDKTDEYAYLEIYQDGIKKIETNILNRTYSFDYNFKNNIKIVISDGINTKEMTYKPEDLINELSVYNKIYAYIYKDKLKGNIKTTDNKVINLYENKALLDNLDVYNMETGKIISSNNKFDIKLVSTKPLYEFKYNDSIIKTFYDYSIVSNDSGDAYYDYMMIVKNGKLKIIDSELKIKRDSIIIDNYSNREFETVLGLDGIIYNIKNKIVFPKNISNKNIVNMSNNINSNSNIAIILYKNGRAVVFNYTTGKIINETIASKKVNIVDYIKDTTETSSITPFSKESFENYNKTQNLVETLEKKPIVSGNNNKYINKVELDKKSIKGDNYIVYYDSTLKDYKIFNESDIINKDNSYKEDDIQEGVIINKQESEKLISENDKILSNIDLVNIYMNESIFTDILTIDSLYIFAGILFSIITSLFIWFKMIRTLKNRS